MYVSILDFPSFVVFDCLCHGIVGAPLFTFACQVANQSDTTLVVLCTYDAELSNNASASSNYLFPRKWHDQKRLFAHPRTWYICELFDDTNGRLAANVTASLPSTYPLSGNKLPLQAQYVHNIPIRNMLTVCYFSVTLSSTFMVSCKHICMHKLRMLHVSLSTEYFVVVFFTVYVATKLSPR